MSRTPTATDWRDLNVAGEAERHAAYLDTVRQVQAAAAYKVRSLALCRLAPGGRALDLGCGTGDDAARLAEQAGPEGQVLGVDLSRAMVEEARRRWGALGPALRFEEGDVRDLRLPEAHFDAARADRVFQHLDDPRHALAELRRVTRPGGRVVLSDPDWGSYLVDLEPGDAARRYHAFATAQATNPWSGRRLYGLLSEAGLVELEVEAHVALFQDLGVLERLGNLEAGFTAAIAAGALSEAEAEALRAELAERQAAGRFFATLTVFTAAGTRPA